MTIGGDFKTSISITPQKSQVFTIALLVLSAISLVASFAFLWTGRERWDVPLFCAAITGGAGMLCWILSHRNADLSGGTPTQLSADDKGMQLSFDVRNPPTKEMLLIFASYAEAAACREPLPKSSGLLNEQGTIIEGSMLAANEQIEKLNLLVAEQAKQVEALSGGVSVSETLSQHSDTAAPGFTGEERVSGVVTGEAGLA
ncbi:hypothetical protein NLO98_08410 [Pseudomonas syringae]|nr:hypothetical protein [Pseudomonas syringae]